LDGLVRRSECGYGWGSESNVFGITQALAPPFDVLKALSFGDHLNGFIGGGQIGYDYAQLLGRRRIAYTNFKGSDSGAGNIVSTLFNGDRTFTVISPWTCTQEQKVKWLATIRGRVGWTPAGHTWLFYATSGLAIGGVEASDLLIWTNGVAWTGKASPTKTGWTASRGVDAKMGGNWTAKVEYFYYDLGNLTVIGYGNTASAPAYTSSTDFAFCGNIIRAGLNYQFGAH
jgi:outer membrane immunogenic protein